MGTIRGISAYQRGNTGSDKATDRGILSNLMWQEAGWTCPLHTRVKPI